MTAEEEKNLHHSLLGKSDESLLKALLDAQLFASSHKKSHTKRRLAYHIILDRMKQGRTA